MKTAKIIPALLLAPLAILLTGCPKSHNPVPPQPDTELQSSVDASYGLLCITDAEMITSFAAEGDDTPDFYMQAPGSPGVLLPIQNIDADFLHLNFNVTDCLDGKHRDGTIHLERSINTAYNPYANGNSRYCRRFGFAGRLTFSDYMVNGWKITTTNADNTHDGDECVILNKLTKENYDPATTSLSWSVKGGFKFTKGDETMFFNVDLVKTLVNTNDPAVFPVSRTAIQWRNATVAYSGKITGFTKGNVPFTMIINEDKPLTRDFKCAPYGSETPGFHPFTNGVAYFNTADLYQREIYYGGSESAGQGQCDNSGAIAIKGISYPVDFIK